MSTLEEDLDFYDNTIFDSLAQLNDSDSNDSEKSKTESEEEEEASNMSEPKSTEGQSKEEEEGEGKDYGEEIGLPETSSEKEDMIYLWLEKESSVSQSVDTWDVPLGPIAWDENDKPFERLLTYADLTLTEEEENGLLTDRIVAACSSYLTESPGNKCHVVAKVSLNNKNLNDIRILGYHRFLQYVDLSWNNLTDLTPLGCIPYLMYLDVSHNLMEEVLRFKAPVNLTYVNYSYNEVWQMDDLTDFWALCYLDLSHNKISKIQGLHNLRYLRHLDLSHNKIERFENLNNLRITDLNLEYNLISRFEMEQGMGMNTLPHLTNLYLNNNLIKTLDFLQGVYHLRKLELQGNNISDLAELSHLKLLTNLRHIDLYGNPISELKPYRNLLLNLLQELKFLDQTDVDISERVAACKKKRFDVQLEAARNNIRMILLEQLNDTSLDMDVLPVDQGPYPFVILVGPSASSKKFIMATLGEKYPEKIYLGRLHTTREVLESEKTILIQTSREDFNEGIKSGDFLCVTENLGHLYGFSRQELGTAIKEHKLCLTCMDMVSALTIHSYGIQPFLVLAILQSKEEHTKRLKQTYGPVLAVLGAAYMAQRQLINTHASNVKRVETILENVIHQVMDKVDDGHSPYLGSMERLPSEDDFKTYFQKCPTPVWGSNSNEANEFSENDISADYSFCYHGAKKCYKCTPSKCGYQTCLMNCDDRCSLESCYTKRLSASEAEIKGESTATSYSATAPSPMKVQISSFEGSSYGEQDPFANWSMPFIDWSEVNLNGLQLEQASELLCEKYVESVMSTRDVYQSLHLDNPGLFSLCVFTDEIPTAVKSIGKFLKEVWKSTPNRKPTFDVDNDLVYKAFVPQKLEKLKEMLRNDFLRADGDGTSKAFKESAPINSPSSIAAEMRLKGYGDSTENL